MSSSIARVLSMLVALSFAAASGCGDGQPSAPAPAATAEPTAAGQVGTAVSKIVFVGQKDACECTRKRIDSGWSALSAVLAEHPQIQVEKIQLDVESKRYDELDDLRSLLVAPGIYCFDGSGKLVELLQGEVEEYKIAELLK